MSVEQQNKNKLRKFLNLLKNAQNMPFIDLVIKNMSAELCGGLINGQLQRHEKTIKITKFLNDNILTCSDNHFKMKEFTRLNVSSALVQFLISKSLKLKQQQIKTDQQASQVFEKICQCVIQKINQVEIIPGTKYSKSQKFLEVNINSLLFDIENLKTDFFDLNKCNENIFQAISLKQIISENSEILRSCVKSGKQQMSSNIELLIGEFKNLQRDEINKQSEQNDDDEQITREQLIQELNKQDFELSSFIDSKFLEECLAPVGNLNNKKIKKISVQKFIEIMENEQQDDKWLVPDIGQIIDNRKRQKINEDDHIQSQIKYLVLSPCLSLILNYSKMLTHEQWEVRQVAASGLQNFIKEVINQKKFDYLLEYAYISKSHENLFVSKYGTITLDIVCSNILPRIIILMLKDQFKDYEDINMVTPVRNQGMNLIQQLCALSIYENHHSKQLQKQILLLLKNLPQLLAVCEHDWQAKQSFFMILKGIVSANKNNLNFDENIYRSNLFDMFGKGMLIVSITHVEDTVKVIVTQIIGDLLQNYFEEDKKKVENVSYIDKILMNLQEALKLTDDIEGSVIFVFNLIFQIVNHPLSKDLKIFSIDCTVLFQFNFHRVLKVRVTLHKLINKLLNLNQLQDKQTLINLHTLLVQSIIMEDDQALLLILKSNLVLTIRKLVGSNNQDNQILNQDLLNQYVEYLSTYLLMPQRFQNWLYSFEMNLEQGCFDQFMFFESPCFEKINNNYWNVVYQPVGQFENNKFYLKKLYSCLDILAIIALESNLEQYFKQFLKMNTNPQLISNNTNIEYLFYENISRRKTHQNQIEQQKYSAQSIGIQLAQIGFNCTSIFEFKKLQNLEQIIQQSLHQIQQMPPNGQLQILFNTLIQLQNELNFSKQNIQQLFQNTQSFLEETLPPLQNVSNLQKILLNNQQLQQIMSALPNKLAQNINEICSLINEMKETIESGHSELYKCLLISQHLREVINSTLNQHSKIELYPKLNDIIYPVWNKLINQKDQNFYFQEINARIITEDLLSCLTSCKKLKARDAILQMILNVLQKDENRENESEQTLTSDIQGCLQILMQWKNKNQYQIFTFYESQQIKNYINDESIFLDFIKCQQYLNCINKFLGVLLVKKEEKKLQQSNDSHISEFIDCLKIIIAQMDKFLKFQFQNVNQVMMDQLISEVFQRLFCALIIEITLNNTFKDQLELLLTSLIVSLVQSLKNSKSQGVSTLNQLLIFCLNPNISQQKQNDQESDQGNLPSYLTYQGLALVQSQLCQGEMNQKIIDYVKIFVLPIIMNIKSGHQQIIKVLGMLIQLLPICLVQDQQEGKVTLQQRISSLADQSKNEELYEILEMLQDSEQFLNVFTQQKMNKQAQALSVYPNSSTELREYQKDGIQWMIKLGRYGLNCALCDDMGLGKTIQSLTVVLNESFIERNKTGFRPVNMVICPNTLTYQWQQEIKKFFAHTNTNCLVYDSTTKYQILNQIKNQQIDVVIVSYEKARQEQNYELLNTDFFYIVLDEGHRIQNSKSKTTLMIKSFKAQRKLVLTGTPLQNKVSELWSIFDFLMPSFLEEEKMFNSKYNQFLTSNLNKLSEKLEETQNFIQALKSLKKRIQPFILRRTKTDVLKDLPPKFIQDFECEMPPAQLIVHQFIDKHFPITQVTQGENQVQKEQGKEKQQIFYNLILHRKVCNHPCFVEETIQNFRNDESKQIVNLLNQIREGKVKKNHFGISFESNKQEKIFLESSGKLKGLVDLLKQCEIIQDENDEVCSENQQKKGKQKKQNDDGAGLGSGLLQLAPDDENDLDFDKFREIEEQNNFDHRALIFCQMKSYLQLIIDSVLIPSGVKFAQLLSQHSGQERFQIVENFNNDTSIKILIMTTAVGGLGLNLTGADTVIFMEHDWNPMKDMQAIDRAHRIGQKRVVNVYRIILRDTLEEKIMGLQRFKKNLAKNLIQSQRSDISLQDAEQMQMHDLLNCFEDHTIIEKQTKNMENGQIVEKQEKGLIGVESYKDKVYDQIDGIITNQLENM